MRFGLRWVLAGSCLLLVFAPQASAATKEGGGATLAGRREGAHDLPEAKPYRSTFFSQAERGPIGTEKLGAVEYTGEGFSDPLQVRIPAEIRELSEPEIRLPDLSLQAVVWGMENPAAIINDKVVRIGDTILGAKVVYIDKKGVLLIYQEAEFIIKPGL